MRYYDGAMSISRAELEAFCRNAAHHEQRDSRSLGLALVLLGRPNDAHAMFVEAIKTNPDDMYAYLQLTLLHGGLPRYWGERLRSSCAGGKLQGVNEVWALFALFEYLHARKEHDAAFDALEEANRLRWLQVAHEYQPCTADAERVRGTIERTVACNRSDDRAKAVFIVGMPRTGTSLLERYLSAVTGAQRLGESCALDQAVARTSAARSVDWQALGVANDVRTQMLLQMHYARLASSLPDVPILDKNPYNFFHIPTIVGLMANAYVVHTVREPVDVCFALYRRYFDDGQEYSYDMRALVQFYQDYKAIVDAADATIPRWAIQCAFEQLRISPVATAVSIAAQMGYADAMPIDTSSIAPLDTLSAAQTRLTVDSEPSWKPYAHRLGPLIEALRQR